MFQKIFLLCYNFDYVDIWQSWTQKRTGFEIPFVVDILVTELPKYLSIIECDTFLMGRTAKQSEIKIKCDHYIKQMFWFLSTSGEPSVNRIDLRALTFVGPLWHKPVMEPLAVHLLKNRDQWLCVTSLVMFSKRKKIYYEIKFFDLSFLLYLE